MIFIGTEITFNKTAYEKRAAGAVRFPCVFILGGRKRIGLGVPFADFYSTRRFLQNYEVGVNSL